MEEAINKQVDKLITYFVIIEFPKKLILGFLQRTARKATVILFVA